jgi:hypothetical protein
MRYTPNAGLPYPDGTDLGDGPSDMLAFASAVDSQFAAVDSGFPASPMHPGFCLVRTVSGGPISANFASRVTFDTTEFDNTGHATSGVGLGSFTVDPVYGVAWWQFGAYVAATPSGGTPTVNAPNRGMIQIQSIDPDTGTMTTSCIDAEMPETDGVNEAVLVSGLVRCYNAFVTVLFVHGDAASSRVLTGGSRFWGQLIEQGA